VCCRVLQSVVECRRVSQSVDECCRVLQCVAATYERLDIGIGRSLSSLMFSCACLNMIIQCVAMCYSTLQCAAVCCSQCVAVCCSDMWIS